MGTIPATSRTPQPRRIQHGFGPQNNFWKGGRVLASNGYVLIRVGITHHLADVRGYAYEHRIAAEAKIGRRLRDGEVVHHVNGNKIDNRQENLEVVPSIAEHRFHHRNRTSGRRTPSEENKAIMCECGCGTELLKYDVSGRPRRFVSGHNFTRTH